MNTVTYNHIPSVLEIRETIQEHGFRNVCLEVVGVKFFLDEESAKDKAISYLNPYGEDGMLTLFESDHNSFLPDICSGIIDIAKHYCSGSLCA